MVRALSNLNFSLRSEPSILFIRDKLYSKKCRLFMCLTSSDISISCASNSAFNSKTMSSPVSRQLEMRVSRSGRLIIPRLKPWTGERIVINKSGIKVIEGHPDCTSTFESERLLFQCQPRKEYVQAKIKKTKKPAVFKKTSPAKVRAESKRNEKSTDSPQVTKIVDSGPKKRKGILKKQPKARKKTDKKLLVDIWGPEFQPVVLLNRLLPEEIVEFTSSGCTSFGEDVEIVVDEKPKKNVLQSGKQKTPKKPETTSIIPFKGKPKTVHETLQMMRYLHYEQPVNIEDEASATAGFFQNTPCRKSTRLISKALEILKDDMGESEDNLSFRTISGRESSPMSSAVSPISSLTNSDAEETPANDYLFSMSPASNKLTSYEHARLVHRNVRDRATLRKKMEQNNRSKKSQNRESPTHSTLPINSQKSVPKLFQETKMRRLERKLKKNAMSNPWAFTAIHKGNVLHISINSDSELSDSSVDSLMDEH